MKKDIDEKTLKEFQNILSYFRKFTTGGINRTEEKFILQMLDRTIKFYFYLTDEIIVEKIERITINKRIHGSNKRIWSINQLKYPPVDIVTKYGRCNLPKQSVFYGTFAWMTALSEMKPAYGDLITRTFWRNKSKSSIRICPIFLNQSEGDFINPRTLDYANKYYEKVYKLFPDHAAEFAIDLFQFISDCFARRIDSGNDRDYIFSAYFSDKILNEFNDGKIDAIYYPSVQEKLSFENLAIKPEVFDRIFELEEVREGLIVTVPNIRFKGYFSEGLYECKRFNFSSNDVLWDQADNRYNPETIEKNIKEFRLDFSPPPPAP